MRTLFEKWKPKAAVVAFALAIALAGLFATYMTVASEGATAGEPYTFKDVNGQPVSWQADGFEKAPSADKAETLHHVSADDDKSNHLSDYDVNPWNWAAGVWTEIIQFVVWQIVVPTLILSLAVTMLMGGGGMSGFFRRILGRAGTAGGVTTGGGPSLSDGSTPGSAVQSAIEKGNLRWMESDHPELAELAGWEDLIGQQDLVAALEPAVAYLKALKEAKMKVLADAEAEKKRQDTLRAEAEKLWSNTVYKAPPPFDLDRAVKDAMRQVGYSSFGDTFDQFIIAAGGAGLGKTLALKILARLADVPIAETSGESFVEMWQGLGQKRMRDLFEQARAKAPCIVIIEECEGLFSRRSGGPNRGESEGCTREFLKQTGGGFGDNIGVFIGCTTNNPDQLDTAAIRYGRFKLVKVHNPTFEERVRLLRQKIGKRNLPLAHAVNVDALATVTAGEGGAFIDGIINEGARAARERAQELAAQDVSKTTVDQEDLWEGMMRHLGGRKSKISLTFSELLTTTVHEGMHGILEALVGHNVVRVLTNWPRDKFLGLMWSSPQGEKTSLTLAEVRHGMMVKFAGSIAQRLLFGDREGEDSGLDSDLEQAANTLHRAIARWGMSRVLGPLSVGRNGHTGLTECSEEQRALIDAECRRYAKAIYGIAGRIVHWALMSEPAWQLFEKLLVKRTLREEDLYEPYFSLLVRDFHTDCTALWQRLCKPSGWLTLPAWERRFGDLESMLTQMKRNKRAWELKPLSTAEATIVSARVARLRKIYAEQKEAVQSFAPAAAPVALPPPDAAVASS